MPKRSFDGRLCAFGQGRRHRCSVYEVPFCYALQCSTRLFNSRSPVTEIGVIFYHSCRSIERQSNFNISAWVSHASCFQMESGVPSRSSLAPALPFFLPPIVIQPPLSWPKQEMETAVEKSPPQEPGSLLGKILHCSLPHDRI